MADLFDEAWDAFKHDRIAPPFVVNKAKYKAYEDAMGLLDELEAKGKLTFKADSLAEEYTMHAVVVTFEADSSGDIEFIAREDVDALVKILGSFDHFSFGIDEPNVWYFTSEIYCGKVD